MAKLTKEELKLSYQMRCKKSGIAQTLPREHYVDNFNKIHNFKYEYPEDQRITSRNKIRIICSDHGEFMQFSHQHAKGSGCQDCRKSNFRYPKKAKYTDETRRLKRIETNTKRRTSPEKIETRFRDKFGDKFEYDFSTYTTVKNPMKMICNLHGEFWQAPFEHYTLNVHGCPSCAKCISNKEIAWLDNLGIFDRQKFINTEECVFKVDGYNKKTRTVYEFLGNFWHGHPSEIERQKMDYNRVSKKTFTELFEITEDRFKKLICLGYNVIYRWETDIIDRNFNGELEWE